MKHQNYGFLAGALMLLSAPLLAQNPIIRDNFTADPSAHVFNGRVYLYPSHDIPAPYDYTGRRALFGQTREPSSPASQDRSASLPTGLLPSHRAQCSLSSRTVRGATRDLAVQ